MRELLEKALKICDSAEIYQRNMDRLTATVKFGEVHSIEADKKTEISLRIIKENRMGTAVATSLEDDTIIDRALISLENQQSEAGGFSNEAFNEVTCASETVEDLNSEKLVGLAMGYSDNMKRVAPEISNSIEISKTLKRVSILNSEGFEHSYSYSNLDTQIVILNDQGFRSVSRSYSQGDFYEVHQEDLEGLVRLHQLGSKPMELGNERMPVIFDGTVMGALMLRVLGGVNGGNVVKGISPINGKIGDELFSDKITIRDDATLEYGCNSFAFDDEGTPAQNTMLFEKGVLKGYLMSRSQAEKLGGYPTGNAQKRTLFSKEIEDVPAIFDTNLIIEGASIPDEDLLKKVNRGLYITGVMGAHTGNIIQGEFSLNISSGYLIENGVLVGKVKGAMIAGNIYDLFKNIEAIGTERKPMRSIFYYMGYSPMVLFKEANIVGK